MRKSKTESKAGRPTSYTEEKHKIIVNVLSTGAQIKTAAAMAGIQPSTIWLWNKKGKTGKNKYNKFSIDIEKSIKSVEVVSLNAIRKAIDKGTWQAAAWMLERKFPEQWARTENYRMSGPNGGPIKTVDATPHWKKVLKPWYDMGWTNSEIAVFTRNRTIPEGKCLPQLTCSDEVQNQVGQTQESPETTELMAPEILISQD